MKGIYGLVAAGGLILGMAGESRAQFAISIGNPYTGQGLNIGNTYGYSPYGAGYGGYGNSYGYGNGYGYGSPYGYGATGYSSTTYLAPTTTYYRSGYSGYAPGYGGYGYGRPAYAAPVYRGYGGGYGGYRGVPFGGGLRGFRR